jgi:hypothetical protein
LNYFDLPSDSIESKCIQSMSGPNAEKV